MAHAAQETANVCRLSTGQIPIQMGMHIKTSTGTWCHIRPFIAKFSQANSTLTRTANHELARKIWASNPDPQRCNSLQLQASSLEISGSSSMMMARVKLTAPSSWVAGLNSHLETPLQRACIDNESRDRQMGRSIDRGIDNETDKCTFCRSVDVERVG